MKLKYKDIYINYTLEGKGETIVLLHGFLHSLEMWNNYKNIWKHQYKVLCIDLPGHGKSGIVQNITIDEIAKIVKSILDKENISVAKIIGHSLGGYVGLAFVELFPNNVEKLILLHSSAYADTDLVKKKRNLSIKILDKHPSMFVHSTIKFLYKKENLMKFKNIIENDIKKAKSIGFEGYKEATIAMRNRPDRTHLLKTFPIYIIAGKHDKVIEKESSEKQISMLNSAKGFFLENSAHMGFIEEEKYCFNTFKKIL